LKGSRNYVFIGQVNNARFHRFPVGNISRNLNATTSIGEAVKIVGIEFKKYRKGSFFQKTQKFLTKCPRFATSGRHNFAMMTDGPKLTTKIAYCGMSSFHFYR